MATYRPKLHFTAKKGWLNDPNGLVYRDGWYHLFYQHHPRSTLWGPMHWGHAISRDLLRWRHLPVALKPNDQGMAFSGSAVVDEGNTSHLGSGRDPMVICYTQHGSVEQQGLYWSGDGIFFRPYPGNPILENPGVPDFRDPKVFRVEGETLWRMALTAGDRICFYQSENLRGWEKTGEILRPETIPSGVLECPDVFPLMAPDGQIYWILLCSIAMAPAQGGSRTLYLIGDFSDGKFVADPQVQASIWLDEGTDCYAGVTYNQAPSGRRIMMAWQSNWAYADKTPTGPYRGTLCVPRELRLARAKGRLVLAQRPVEELKRYRGPFITFDTLPERERAVALPGECFEITLNSDTPYVCRFENDSGDCLLVGLDGENQYFIDRSCAGQVAFSPHFYPRSVCKRLTDDEELTMRLIFDTQTVEAFFDGGRQVMSAQVFPKTPFTRVRFTGAAQGTVYQLMG